MGKQRIVKTSSPETFGVTRDGELIGAGLSRVDAETLVSESALCYPGTMFKVIPQPKKAGSKKVNP
jgi:hypothetical protein